MSSKMRFRGCGENVSCRVNRPLFVDLRRNSHSEMTTLSKVTVLILDDNPLVLKLGRALLEREGCTVLTASSWIEFNHVLAGNTPDIIFLDVNLPSIKGNRLSEVLKSQSSKKDIPIVLISDLPEKSLEEMFPSSGANAWMRKPLTRDKMVDMITRHVAG